MKESKFTGEYIYSQISRLQKEYNEIYDALDDVEHNTHPHNLLKKALEEKRIELQKAKKAEYSRRLSIQEG